MSAIDDINVLERDAFIALLGSLYEHSPWAAERTFASKPFKSDADLAQALARTVDSATEAERLALVRAHPELAGEKLRAKTLTRGSMSEQVGAGLDKLSPTEIAEWTELNASYRERFGFPFVICVRLHSRGEILEAMHRRRAGTAQGELAEAIRQIHDIARLRLADLVAKMDQAPAPPGDTQTPES